MSLVNILKSKCVSVWGVGYLGYTTMLRFQNAGFKIIAYDPNIEQLQQFKTGHYPNRDRLISWSKVGFVPKLNFDNVHVASNPRELFLNSSLHMICLPDKRYMLEVVKFFRGNIKKAAVRPMVVFESSFVPGHVENDFINKLASYGKISGRDYMVACLFRTDWKVESFFMQKDKMPIAGCCKKSLEIMRELTRYLGIETIEFDSIKEAELYNNSLNAFQSVANDFVRQLAFGYPGVNFKKLAQLLFENFSFEECNLNIGTGGMRMTFALDYLIEGSDNPDKLTLLKESQNVSISSVLSYAEYLIRKEYKNVAILGITYSGNQKDLVLSPSITLADYLIKNGVNVYMHDPLCSGSEIKRLVKGVKILPHFSDKPLSVGAIILASDHSLYKYLKPSSVQLLCKKARLIIDNHGIWSRIMFSTKARYHQVGDGSLFLSK